MLNFLFQSLPAQCTSAHTIIKVLKMPLLSWNAETQGKFGRNEIKQIQHFLTFLSLEKHYWYYINGKLMLLKLESESFWHISC